MLRASHAQNAFSPYSMNCDRAACRMVGESRAAAQLNQHQLSRQVLEQYAHLAVFTLDNSIRQLNGIAHPMLYSCQRFANQTRDGLRTGCRARGKIGRVLSSRRTPYSAGKRYSTAFVGMYPVLPLESLTCSQSPVIPTTRTCECLFK